MSTNPIRTFMKTSELYFKFTDLKNASFDFNKLEPFNLYKSSATNEQKKSENNKSFA